MIPFTYGITFFTGKNATVWGVCKNQTYAVSTSKITVRYPNETVWQANQTMTVISIGQFKFDFTAPNITGNYLTSMECDIGGTRGFAEDDFWVKEEEIEITSLAVVVFMVMIISGLFLLPKILNVKSKYLSSTIKGLSITLGLWFIALGTTIVATVADKAELGITQELLRILYIVNWAAYLAIVITIIYFAYQMVLEWRIDRHNRRMGYEDDEG